MPAAALYHGGQESLHHVHDTKVIDIHHLVKDLKRDLLHIARMRNPCGIDEQVGDADLALETPQFRLDLLGV